MKYCDPINIDLKPYLESNEMQRLKEIDMNCGMNYTSVPLFLQAESYSRYEHSLGVAQIIAHFTSDKAQILSGLFHDIATPTFSHVVDFMNGDAAHQESTEELTHQMIVESSTIMNLLKQDNLTIEQVDDYHQYPIADNDSPRLSSDRLEYTLNCCLKYHLADPQIVQAMYDDLVVGKNEEGETEIMFQHASYASTFASYALKCGKVFASNEDRYCMEVLAQLLKKAMQEQIITKEDLYTTEEKVVRKISNSKYKDEWNAFQRISAIEISNDKQPGWIQIAAKKRYINPYCCETMSRVESFDEAFHQEVIQYKNAEMKEWMRGIENE